MLRVDVIIPSYNNKTELLACLDGFSKQTYSLFRVFVCIDGSSDNSAETVRANRYKFEITVLEHQDKTNKGRNAARNLAFSYLNSDIVLFFDSDIVPSPDLIQQHVSVSRQQECISVGSVHYLNRNENIWAGYISTRGYNKFAMLQSMPVEYLNMGNVAMPTRFFTELGGMDSQLVKYGGDDTELAIRLIKAYKPIVLNNKSAIGYTVSGKTLEFALKQLEEFGAYNLKYIHRKHPGFGYIFAYDLFNGKNFKSILFRQLMNESLMAVLLRNINNIPLILRNKTVHLLAAYYLYQGFKRKP